MNEFLLFLLLLLGPIHLHGETNDYASANLTTFWTNARTTPRTLRFPSGATVKALLLRHTSSSSSDLAFVLAFYCGGNPCDRYLLSILIVGVDAAGEIAAHATPQVVWSANRNRLAREGAVLLLSRDGELKFTDADGSLVWTTKTAGKSVTGLNLTPTGNLVLIDAGNAVVWQSFDHPTDVLVSGQSLAAGQRLTANLSMEESTEGRLYISHTTIPGFGAFINSTPPQVYYKFVDGIGVIKSTANPCFLNVTSKSLTFISNSSQYLRLESNGHLKLYEWMANGKYWNQTADAIKPYLGYDCGFPTSCGANGICSRGQCGCLPGADFVPVNGSRPGLGCSRVHPFSCVDSNEVSGRYRFAEVEDVSYFNYIDDALRDPNVTTADGCKYACLRNCSCVAALFRYGLNASQGSCYLPSEIFTLVNNTWQIGSHYNSTAYIKVMDIVFFSANKPTEILLVLLVTIVGVIVLLLFTMCVVRCLVRMCRRLSRRS